jgi:hypothetical protein
LRRHIGGVPMCCFNQSRNAQDQITSGSAIALMLTDLGGQPGRRGREADQIRSAGGGNNGPRWPNKIRDTMRLDSMCVAAAILGMACLTIAAAPTFAQGPDPKATEQRPANGENGKDGKDGQKKVDEFAEAERLLGGPAANPECMWLGRRVVSLLWRDDLDTAFRHLDLYDRFGCPAGHIQTAFRCVVRQGNIKAPELLDGRIHACWINPNTDPVIMPPAAAAAAAPSQAQ